MVYKSNVNPPDTIASYITLEVYVFIVIAATEY